MIKKSNLTLVIGDKNLSSWSMRPWLALKASGLDFTEEKLRLDDPSTKKSISRFSPSGRVPVLLHNGLKVWDSLSICEYIAELAPDKKLWPSNPSHRAIARSLVCEMHSGFQALRGQMSMDIQLKMNLKHLTPQTISDVERIVHIWHHSMRTNGGPFLIGEFGIIDAFFAPVVLRFQSYGIKIKDKDCQKYMDNISNQKFVKSWVKEAKLEKPIEVMFSPQ